MKADVLLVCDANPTSIRAEPTLKEVVKRVDVAIVLFILSDSVKHFWGTICIQCRDFKLERVVLMRFADGSRLEIPLLAGNILSFSGVVEWNTVEADQSHIVLANAHEWIHGDSVPIRRGDFP